MNQIEIHSLICEFEGKADFSSFKTIFPIQVLFEFWTSLVLSDYILGHL